MPCTYYSPGEEAEMAAERFDELKGELDLVTRLLCTLCDQLGRSDLPPDVLTWWKRHQNLDRQRVRAEKNKKLEKIRQDLTKVTKARRDAMYARACLESSESAIAKYEAELSSTSAEFEKEIAELEAKINGNLKDVTDGSQGTTD